MKNDISISKVFDFKVFAVKDVKNYLSEDIKSNESRLIVIYKEEDDSDDTLDLLKKILAAIKIDINKDAILLKLTDEDAFSLVQLLKNSKVDKSLVFGVAAKQLGLHFEYTLYRKEQVGNHQFLMADSLQQILENTFAKKQLWQALQKMFL